MKFFSNNTKFFASLALLLAVCTLYSFRHPFYMSVCEFNWKDKELNASVKMFTNDLEDALRKSSGKKVDLINGTNKEELNALISEYIKKRLKVKINNEPLSFQFIGFEREEDAIWSYIEYKNCPKPKNIEIENSLLYDYINNQINIVHFEIGTDKKSSKVNKPEKLIKLEF